MEMSLQAKTRCRSKLIENFVQSWLGKEHVNHLSVAYILPLIHDILVEHCQKAYLVSVVVWTVFKRKNGFCGYN